LSWSLENEDLLAGWEIIPRLAASDAAE